MRRRTLIVIGLAVVVVTLMQFGGNGNQTVVPVRVSASASPTVAPSFDPASKGLTKQIAAVQLPDGAVKCLIANGRTTCGSAILSAKYLKHCSARDAKAIVGLEGRGRLDCNPSGLEGSFDSLQSSESVNIGELMCLNYRDTMVCSGPPDAKGERQGFDLSATEFHAF